MKFISVDGDDIGQQIIACYLDNNASALFDLNILVQNKVQDIARFLRNEGFTIIFCAADGVAASIENFQQSDAYLYERINELAGTQLNFSVGVGATLREAYIALLSAKSRGKARIFSYEDLN